jgi:hypothetical protein
MKLGKVVAELKLTPLFLLPGSYENEIKGCYIGDLLSNVMAQAREGDLWLTVQTSMNVVAVARLLDLAGVIIVEGHLPQEDTLKKAEQEGIPLFSTRESAYKTACLLYGCGVGREQQ